MSNLQDILVHELQQADGIYEASVLISEVRFLLRGKDITYVRCRIWYDLDQRQYRYQLSHELPGMVASGTVWAGSPGAVLQLALDRLTEDYSTGSSVQLVENPFFDNPNAE